MATYGNFEAFPGVEFTDPTITPNSIGVSIDSVSPPQIGVDVLLEVADAVKASVRLSNVPVENLDYEPTSLMTRITDYLNANHLIS